MQKIREVCKTSPRIPEGVWESWGSDHVWGSPMQAFLQRPHSDSAKKSFEENWGLGMGQPVGVGFQANSGSLPLPFTLSY